jgi:plasmid maintenance system antidote protein VapI
MALRLGKFCGNGPDLWISMQQAYDLWQASKKVGKEVGRIRTVAGAAAI